MKRYAVKIILAAKALKSKLLMKTLTYCTFHTINVFFLVRNCNIQLVSLDSFWGHLDAIL